MANVFKEDWTRRKKYFFVCGSHTSYQHRAIAHHDDDAGVSSLACCIEKCHNTCVTERNVVRDVTYVQCVLARRQAEQEDCVAVSRPPQLIQSPLKQTGGRSPLSSSSSSAAAAADRQATPRKGRAKNGRHGGGRASSALLVSHGGLGAGSI